MRASEFEFRHRFWIILGIYAAAFACSLFDRQQAAVALAERVFGAPAPQTPGGLRGVQFFLGIATLLVFAGAALRTWASAYLASEIVHDASVRTDALVADGPYRFVRNPLYLGTLLVAAGIGLLASRTGWIVLVGGFLLFEQRLIGREEAALAERLGEPFREYCARVPRRFAALRPRLPASGRTAKWGQAFAGEGFMWALTASMVALTATLSARVGLVLLLGSVAGRIVTRRLQKQRSASASE